MVCNITHTALFSLIIALTLVACGTQSSSPTPSSGTSSAASSAASPASSQASLPASSAAPKPTVTSTRGPQTIEVKYTYDGAGRLTQAEYSNGVVIKYTYDKAENLLSQEMKK